MECDPTLKFPIVNVATPELSKVPVPICVALSKNVTVPDGVPMPAIGTALVTPDAEATVLVRPLTTGPILFTGGAIDVTVAVKVTGWPKTDGLTEDASATADGALLTTWFRTDDALLAKFASPL